MKRNLKWGGIAASIAGLLLGSSLLTAGPASATVIVPAGLWTEHVQSVPPPLTAKTVWYKVGAGYVGETALDSQYNGWAGELFTTTQHTELVTTQRLTGTAGADWVCFNLGRSGINSVFHCFSPPDY